jgi:murein DD-endopeptidase MepM/ murein hydrolase activator NlpD
VIAHSPILRAAIAAALVTAAAPRVFAEPISVAIRSRAIQQGDLLLITVQAPVGVDLFGVRAFGHEWPVYRVDPSTWRTLVGIDLDQRPGQYAIDVTTVGHRADQKRSITVLARQFPRRVLQVAPEYVNPPPEDLERISRDAAFLERVYGHSDDHPQFLGGFERPVPGQANSSFGSRSVFNGEPRSPHAGTDFLSGTGTPIHAPAAGRVVAARDLFFTGNTVIIDHGLGVMSLLAHMSRIDVQEGQTVDRGDLVGLVGATGRVTGPHLHWALRVGAARVDPLSAIEILAAPVTGNNSPPK